VALRNRAQDVALICLAALLCAAYPLSAQLAGPIALPAGLATVGATVLILRRPEYGVAIAVALAPMINTVIGGTRALQIVVPALAAGTLIYGLLIDYPHRWGRETKMLAWAMGVFLFVALIASVQALEPSESVAKALLVVTGVTLFAAVRQVCTERPQQLVLLGGVVAGLAAAAIQGIVQHFLGIFSTEGFVADFEVVGRVQGSFGHPNLYAGYLATLLPLALALGFSRRFPAALRGIALLAAAVTLPALYFTFARGAIIGLVGGAVIWFAVFKPRTAFVVAVTVVIAAVFLAPATLKERFDPEESGSDVTLRADIWKSAFDIYGDHPLLGVGVNNFGVAYERLPAVTDAGSQRRLLHQDLLLIPPHPQNMYLQALAEQGIVGFLALLGLIGAALTVLFRAARSSSRFTRLLGFSVGIGFTGVLIHGFLEVPLMGEAMLPLFALLAVTAAAVESSAAEPVGAQPTRKREKRDFEPAMPSTPAKLARAR
jgi:O-antigen ligase